MIDFFDDLFDRKSWVFNRYTQISYSEDGHTLFESQDAPNDTLPHSKQALPLKFVPDYLALELKNKHLFHIGKVNHVKGYSIYLDGFASAEDYLKKQFRSKAKTIRRYTKRLESCFNISYKLYHGQIDKAEYRFIMDALESMKEKRFDRRNDKDESLSHWEYTRETTFARINKKQASLFVIYNETKPIEISINFHFDNILYSCISSYDIDYSKFGLGHIEIFKQIEWCIQNNYKVFEMGRGDLDYKRRWSNKIYFFQYQLVYPKGSIIALFKLIILKAFLSIKVYIKSKKIHLYFKKLLKSKPNPIENDAAQYKIIPAENDLVMDSFCPIDHMKGATKIPLEIIRNFQYTHTEHTSDLSVYQSKKDGNFLIKGKNSKARILLEKKETL